ncbi:MAG TPA: ABC transporter [Ruminococcaceae bacterium]|jgi:putative ABC transport system ATP-binding protein|nr:ABC transporter [Oscillospiraceae bacterium]
MKAVELNNVCKKYGSRVILKGVSFFVDDGELVALIGPSGCGKSTILNMIGVLETVDQGEIRIFGKILPPIDSHRATLMRRDTINYLFQSFALINDMTVCQNLLLSMHFLSRSDKDKMESIDQMLNAVHLLPLKNATVNTLSGGEQQRVALARTMLKPGKLILADEPTGSLDAHSADISFSLIQSLCKKYGKTVIMVTHSPELAQRADRIIDLTEFRQGQSQ